MQINVLKGYQSKKNPALLAKHKLKKSSFKESKQLIGRARCKVVRTFGSIKRWFNGVIARYSRIKKIHTQNVEDKRLKRAVICSKKRRKLTKKVCC